MKKTPTEMQQLTIRRITVKNAHTVRYRVYSDTSNYIAVIAENALMAMKLTGIHAPFKVVRDLISEEMAIPESSVDTQNYGEYVLPVHAVLAHEKNTDPSHFINPDVAGFEPLSMASLQKSGKLNEGVVAPAALLRVLEESATAEQPPLAQHEAFSEEVTVEVKPLNLAQETLLQKAEISPDPLSASDVVQLLSPNAD